MTRHTPFGFYGTGLLFIVLGIVAIVEPLVAGLAMTMVLGWLLMIGGVVHGIGAVDAEDFGRALLRVAVGLAYALTGLYLLMHPVIALGTLTLVLGAVLFIQA